MKLEVSTNFMVTDLCFCTSVRSFGSSGWSLALPFSVELKVALSFEWDARSECFEWSTEALTATAVSPVSVNSENPEIEIVSVPPLLAVPPV